MIILDCELGSTVYVPFALNDTGGSAADGSSPVADVRLCGAAVDAAPVLSPTVTGPLSHANYGDGLYEVPVACTALNGFAAGNYYTVYAGATVDTETPQAALAIIRVVAAGDSLHSGAARVMDAVPDAAAGAAGGLAIVGSEMDLVDAPNGTAVTAIQAGLSTYAGGAVASVSGDVGGKVLGGGASTITGTGVRAVDGSGNAIAPAATALSTATWTGTRAAYIDNLSAGAAALEATLTAIKGAGWSNETLVAIKALLDTAAADVSGLNGASMVAAAPTVGQIDTQLSNTHGAGLWGGTSGSGDTTCTVTVTDGTDPLPNVNVTIRNSGDTATVAGPLQTDENGEIEFHLTDGTSYLAVPRTTPGYSGGSTPFTMDGVTPVECAMTAATLPAAAPANYCTVYVAEELQNGDYPVGHFWITAYKSPATRTVGAVKVDITYGPDECDISATTGQASLQILQGAVVSLKVKTEDQTLEKVDVVVPASAGPVNWNDLVAEA